MIFWALNQLLKGSFRVSEVGLLDLQHVIVTQFKIIQLWFRFVEVSVCCFLWIPDQLMVEGYITPTSQHLLSPTHWGFVKEKLNAVKNLTVSYSRVVLTYKWVWLRGSQRRKTAIHRLPSALDVSLQRKKLASSYIDTHIHLGHGPLATPHQKTRTSPLNYFLKTAHLQQPLQ